MLDNSVGHHVLYSVHARDIGKELALDLDSFFENLDNFEHSDLFHDIQDIWDPLDNLDDSIIRKLGELADDNNIIRQLAGVTTKHFIARDGNYREQCLLVNQWIETLGTVYLPDLNILLGQGTLLEPSAIIKGPAIIGKYCDIRQGSYIRGNAVIGNRSVVGHCTEVKNSIVMNHSEAGHFNYIGDSILGSYVNLGAGSKLANLQLRTPKEKQNDIIYPIKVSLEGGTRANTEMEKLGAVLGDYVDIGCNTVTSPGTFIGKRCWVYPNQTISKGFYRPDEVVKGGVKKNMD